MRAYVTDFFYRFELKNKIVGVYEWLTKNGRDKESNS